MRRARSPAAPRTAPRSSPLAGASPLLAALVVGAALRVWLFARTSGLTMDSPLYVRMAGSLGRRGEPLGPAHHGYSALIAIASLAIPGRELPARIVSWIAGTALIAITYALARRRVGPGWAGLAAGLVALHPLLAVFSAAVMTEATFQALTYGALLIATSGAVAVAAAVLGLAYCVRPEAAVVALASVPALARPRRWLVWLGVFALFALPEVALLSLERGALTVTPKTNLVAAAGAARDDAEWRVRTVDSLAALARRPWLERVGVELPAAARRYPDRLGGQLSRIHQAWPAPLLLLSAIGAVTQPGILLAPLALVPILPALGVTPHLRYPMTLVPALAIYAAIGASWLAARAARGAPRRLGPALAAIGLVVLGGLAWCWQGAAGNSVRRFEDGPIHSLRRAGEWLALHGRPGARVMDRKPYVPFFAGMDQVLMPDDDYDTIVEYARRSGADYLVIEEYVMTGMRRQFVPLMTDSTFRARERRLRMVFGGDEGPRTGVAIFEVEPAR